MVFNYLFNSPQKPRDLHNLFDRNEDTGGGSPGAVTAGTTSVLVKASNPRRKKFTLCNDSDTVVYASKSASAQLNAGIRLNAYGGSYIDEPDTLGYIYRGPWSVITSAVGKVVTFFEEV